METSSLSLISCCFLHQMNSGESFCFNFCQFGADLVWQLEVIQVIYHGFMLLGKVYRVSVSISMFHVLAVTKHIHS